MCQQSSVTIVQTRTQQS